MELYSSRPPHMAPSRLTAIMPEIAPRERNKVENRMPEKNMGLVSTMAKPIRPSQPEGKPPVWAIHQPIAKLNSRSR